MIGSTHTTHHDLNAFGMQIFVGWMLLPYGGTCMDELASVHEQGYVVPFAWNNYVVLNSGRG